MDNSPILITMLHGVRESVCNSKSRKVSPLWIFCQISSETVGLIGADCWRTSYEKNTHLQPPISIKMRFFFFLDINSTDVSNWLASWQCKVLNSSVQKLIQSTIYIYIGYQGFSSLSFLIIKAEFVLRAGIVTFKH